MAKTITHPSVFTHPEWTLSNKTKYKNAELERQFAERLVDESGRLIGETEETTDKTNADVNKKIQQRLNDIKYWKKEVEEKLDDIVTEIDNILAYEVRLKKALEACAEPLHIVEQCLAHRQNRYGIDLVHDDVQKELIKEKEVILGVMALLQRTIDQAKEQIRLNRKAKYKLEQDLKDKGMAKDIDEYCAELKFHSPNIYYKDGVSKIQANSSTPPDWEDFSNENILYAERQRDDSINLRSLIDGVLQQTANDMRKQCDDVNNAFDRRIWETKDTKGKLEEHLAKVFAQIKAMEENIAQLEMAIAAKANPLKLAQTRLDTRKERPNVELCRDPAHYRLIEEVQTIINSIENLEARLADSRTAHKKLVTRQLDLEDDIKVKANTLYIDDVQCMGLRKSMNIEKF